MAIEDYIPNIFGSTPEAYRGLLTPEQSAGLEKRANIGGLLGSLGALAQGMSPQGYRRSPLQNILAAAGAGFGAAGQTYESGISQLGNLQKLQQSQIEFTRQQQAREAIEKVIQTPEVANNPALVAYFRANPDKALERYINIAETQAARGVTPTPTVPAAPVSKYTTPAATDTEAWRRMEESAAQPAISDTTKLAPVTVEAAPSRYAQQLREAEAAQAYFSRTGNVDRAKAAREEADNIRNLIRQEELAGSVEKSLVNVHPMLQPMVNALNQNAPSMTSSEIQSAISDIRKKDAEFRLNTETDLRKEFSAQPIVKEYGTVESAYKTISNALSNPSAANDLAAATKFMKLLDPGSVVRESEFGMAVAATGVFDRMNNYLQYLQSGQRLNDAQRADFKKAADLVYQAAKETYNQSARQYMDLAKTYNVNPNNVVLPENKSRTPATSTTTSTAPPPVNRRGWKLEVDAAGNRAYVSPDRTQFEEVK